METIKFERAIAVKKDVDVLLPAADRPALRRLSRRHAWAHASF